MGTAARLCTRCCASRPAERRLWRSSGGQRAARGTGGCATASAPPGLLQRRRGDAACTSSRGARSDSLLRSRPTLSLLAPPSAIGLSLQKLCNVSLHARCCGTTKEPCEVCLYNRLSQSQMDAPSRSHTTKFVCLRSAYYPAAILPRTARSSMRSSSACDTRSERAPVAARAHQHPSANSFCSHSLYSL